MAHYISLLLCNDLLYIFCRGYEYLSGFGERNYVIAEKTNNHRCRCRGFKLSQAWRVPTPDCMFQLCFRCSMEFRSGLIVQCFALSHPWMVLAVCFGSLSCWKSQAFRHWDAHFTPECLNSFEILLYPVEIQNTLSQVQQGSTKPLPIILHLWQ